MKMAIAEQWVSRRSDGSYGLPSLVFLVDVMGRRSKRRKELQDLADARLVEKIFCWIRIMTS